jgi:hypothetical protein
VVSLRYAAPDANQESGYIEGSVQAAVTRPFADEYRTLEDNTPLLTQVAELTGGRVLTGDPAREDLWSREGVVMPVALRAIWLWAAVLAISLFLMDVGVRRVRIDIPAMWRSLRRGMSRGEERGGAHVGSLRAARAQAQAKIQERGSGAGTLSAAQLEAQAKEAVQRARVTATAKFEASAEQLKKTNVNVALGGAEARVEPTKPVAPKGDAGAVPGEGMGRLMKAKQKAREGMEDGGG